MSVVVLRDRMSHNFYCQACRSSCDERYVCDAKRRKHNDYVIWRTHKYVSIKPKKKSFLLKFLHNVLSRTHTTQAVQPYHLYICMWYLSRVSRQIAPSLYIALCQTLCRLLHALDDDIFCSALLTFFFSVTDFFLYHSVLFGISNNQCSGAHETTSNDTMTRVLWSQQTHNVKMKQTHCDELSYTLAKPLSQSHTHTHAHASARYDSVHASKQSLQYVHGIYFLDFISSANVDSMFNDALWILKKNA